MLAVDILLLKLLCCCLSVCIILYAVVKVLVSTTHLEYQYHYFSEKIRQVILSLSTSRIFYYWMRYLGSDQRNLIVYRKDSFGVCTVYVCMYVCMYVCTYVPSKINWLVKASDIICTFMVFKI